MGILTLCRASAHLAGQADFARSRTCSTVLPAFARPAGVRLRSGRGVGEKLAGGAILARRRARKTVLATEAVSARRRLV